MSLGSLALTHWSLQLENEKKSWIGSLLFHITPIIAMFMTEFLLVPVNGFWRDMNFADGARAIALHCFGFEETVGTLCSQYYCKNEH